ncbi:MAG: hypothetical protein LAO51_19980 [Acidobacteriia bacterium]|nr:hypothetical protein [Terriglobia bacterium]
METFEASIKSSYVTLRSIYLGKAALQTGLLPPGKVTVLIEGLDGFTAEGTLNQYGLLTGMAAVYQTLRLTAGSRLKFTVQNPGNDPKVVILEPRPPQPGELPLPGDTTPAPTPPEATVFERLNLRHVHLEPFRPENLNNWEPETEADVYLAFGVLQDFTDFRYCCGASKAVLSRLGANYDEVSKPDAILIDRTTERYLMAEWKKLSSDFKLNHRPDEVDVLICWHDDEDDRRSLPPRVVALHSVARTAAETSLLEE